MKYLIAFCIIIVLFAGCKKNQNNSFSEDQVTFCYFDGLCWTFCRTAYKVSNQQLIADSINISKSGIFTFTPYQTLTNAKYLIAKPAKDNLPQYLLDHPNQTFGSPGVADALGIYIELLDNGTKTNWHIDTRINNLPTEIRAYITQVDTILQQLR